MRGSVVALALLALLVVVAQEGHGEGTTIRLCGRDFIRAIVFTCGSSRWKRRLTDYHYLFASSVDAAESDNPLPFSQENKGYTDSSPRAALETNSEEIQDIQPGTERDSRRRRKKSTLKKREAARLLATSCCSTGCSEREISSLC